MGEKTREKIIDRINVPVLGTAKRVLNDFQEKGGYGSQSDALSDLLLKFAEQEDMIEELKAQLAEAKKGE